MLKDDLSPTLLAFLQVKLINSDTELFDLPMQDEIFLNFAIMGMLMVLLQLEKADLELLISECNYSEEFIKKANDLQLLDAISECYEEYKVLNKTVKY